MTESNERHTRLHGLLGPSTAEVGCDACFDQLDRYVEAELAGRDVDRAFPGLGAHLDGCPACHEEHASLYALLLADGR
jgi:hypothetical protein